MYCRLNSEGLPYSIPNYRIFVIQEQPVQKGSSGVSVRYLITSKHVWCGAHAVMRYSPFSGDPVYVLMFTPTVYGFFPNSGMDDICPSF